MYIFIPDSLLVFFLVQSDNIYTANTHSTPWSVSVYFCSMGSALSFPLHRLPIHKRLDIYKRSACTKNFQSRVEAHNGERCWVVCSFHIRLPLLFFLLPLWFERRGTSTTTTTTTHRHSARSLLFSFSHSELQAGRRRELKWSDLNEAQLRGGWAGWMGSEWKWNSKQNKAAKNASVGVHVLYKIRIHFSFFRNVLTRLILVLFVRKNVRYVTLWSTLPHLVSFGLHRNVQCNSMMLTNDAVMST